MTADSVTVAYADDHISEAVLTARQDVRAIERNRTGTWPRVKRVSDVVLASVLILVTLPLLAVIAVLIKLDSPGPVLFCQRRFGRGLREFGVLKFRTMVHGASDALHKQYIAELMSDGGGEADGLKKLTHDPRVTRVGRVLRRTSLDELPQLFNVVAGHMSLVGPRPALDYELEHYDADHFARFEVRPGLTGLWQVSGRSELGFREMLDLDARYAREGGPAMDLRIFAKTPITVLRKSAA